MSIASRLSGDRRHPDRTEKSPPDGLAGFERFARNTAIAMGRPAAFLAAVAVVVVWAAAGPIFNFSDTWQLAINTGTTIVTFLMVFLIQQSQNRDSLAVQLKLAELIIAVKGAHNSIATAEVLSEEELKELHDEMRKKAEKTLASDGASATAESAV